MNENRRFGFLDHFALWASLGASLYLMPFGSLLVPALSIEQAVLATMVAGLIGGLIIAAVAAVAAGTGKSTVELLAAPFGDAGRWPVAALLTMRHLLFVVFALVLITDSAELISERSLGAGLRPLWAGVFGIAALGLIAAGPDRVSTGMRRAGLWLVLLVAVAVTASAYAEFEIPSYLRRPAVGGWPSFWQATDIMLIFPLLWLPVVADFARFGRDSRSAARGSFAGIFAASVWFGFLGIVYLPATDSGDIPGFLVGMQLGVGTLLLLFLLQIDELYVSAFATVPLVETLTSKFQARLVPVALFVVAIPAAVILNVADLEGYLLLAAAVFVPGFAVVIARALVPERQFSAGSAAAWIAGFVLYQWITPADVGWWQDAISAPFDSLGLTFPLSESADWLGAAVPSFLLAFCIELLGPLATRLVEPRGRPQEAAG
jgi:NCS1 family nucleobase:cation symporter-1